MVVSMSAFRAGRCIADSTVLHQCIILEIAITKTYRFCSCSGALDVVGFQSRCNGALGPMSRGDPKAYVSRS